MLAIAEDRLLVLLQRRGEVVLPVVDGDEVEVGDPGG
jgi:hypothetical protein